jgi:hypothetical protein
MDNIKDCCHGCSVETGSECIGCGCPLCEDCGIGFEEGRLCEECQ